ncbi:MAG: O-antigen ligase family protein [Verrucomicrobiota bacterium]|nr:O-antigen ligase family protein [Verrucomicrobiota bacterium]
MSGNLIIPRGFIVFGLCIPLAIFLGFMLADPLDTTNMMVVGIVLLGISTPIILKHHYFALIFSWNAFVNAFFLPGQPSLWLALSGLSLFLAVLTKALNRDALKFYWEPSIILPLGFLIAVVVGTAYLTGGIGMQALGSQVYGGRRYAAIGASFLGFLALTSRGIEPQQRNLVLALFLIPPVTAAFSNLAYAIGPSAYILFYLFPTDWVLSQAVADSSIESAGQVRIGGLAPAAFAICTYILAKYRLEDLINLRKPVAMLCFIGSISVGLFSGFRSTLVLLGIVLIILFILEGLHKTKAMILSISIVLAGLFFIYASARFMPHAIQRSLSLLPGLQVDSVAKFDAEVSLEWRFQMWEIVLAEASQYFWIGKGYAINPMDLFLSTEAVKRGFAKGYEPAIIAGDYHNGPLSIIIPFGIFGTIGFIWFIIAGCRLLRRNLLYGDPDISHVNRFLYAFFLAKIVFFVFFFGAFSTDLPIFAGILGLSIALNKGIRMKAPALIKRPADIADAFVATTPSTAPA